MADGTLASTESIAPVHVGTSSIGSDGADAPPPAFRPRAGRRRIPIAPIAVALEMVAIILIWQYLQGDLQVVNKIFLPAPNAIADVLVEMLQSGADVTPAGNIYTHAWLSVSSFAIGFGLAAVVGIPLGLLIGGWFPAQKLIAPLLWALYAMPLIAIRPMTTWWFGFGREPIIFLVFLAALLPIALNTAAGVSTVDPVLKRTARVFGATKLDTYRKVVLPSAVPFILTGLRLAVIIGWIILLVSEMVGSVRGFGAILTLATNNFRPALVFASIVIIVLFSVLSVRLISLFEDRVSSWRPEHD